MVPRLRANAGHVVDRQGEQLRSGSGTIVVIGLTDSVVCSAIHWVRNAHLHRCREGSPSIQTPIWYVYRPLGLADPCTGSPRRSPSRSIEIAGSNGTTLTASTRGRSWVCAQRARPPLRPRLVCDRRRDRLAFDEGQPREPASSGKGTGVQVARHVAVRARVLVVNESRLVQRAERPLPS
jgi:hypothetical protein